MRFGGSVAAMGAWVPRDGGDGGADGGGGAGWVDLLLGLPGWVYATVSVVMVLVLLVGLFAVRRLVRRVSRSPLLSRDSVDRGLLTLRSQASGPAGELARLRLGMRAAVEGVQAAVATAQAANQPVGDLALLTGRLAALGAQLDTELQAVTTNPASAQAQEARQRAEELIRVAGRAQRTARSAGRALAGDELRALSGEVDAQDEAVQQYLQAYRELGSGRL